jgi:ABC-2 family transporter protein
VTTASYTSAVKPGRDGFGSVLLAEWTKFRTVRGWLIAALGVAALTAAGPVWLAGTATNSTELCTRYQCQVQGQAIATGPSGAAVTDQFTFVHQPIAASGSITVHVTAFHGSSVPHLPPTVRRASGTQPWAKAGLIIKASTKPGSAYAAVMLTGGHGVRMQYDFTHDIAGNVVASTSAASQWLRLTRSGDTITGYESGNARQWTRIGTAVLAGLPPTAQAGMFVTSPPFRTPVGSGDDIAGGPTRATATFSQLSLHGGLPGHPWNPTQVGAATVIVQRTPDSKVSIKPLCQQCGQTTESAGRFTLTGSGDIAPFEPTVDPLRFAFIGSLFGLITVIALGAVFITTEYRRALIRTTVTASPRRGRILLAKAIVVGVVTFAAALLGAAIAFPVVEHKLYEHGWKPPVWPELALTSGTGLRIVLGTAAIAAGAAVLGLAAGAAFRRSAAAVTAVIAGVIVPLILAQLLPISAAQWLLRITPAAAFSLQGSVQRYPQVSYICAPYHECYPLAPWTGFAVLAAWGVVALAGAVYLMRRRDL